MARSATLSREELAASVTSEAPVVTPDEPTIPLDTVVSELTPYFTGDADRFGQCRVAYEASQAGHSDSAIADAVTQALIALGRDAKQSVTSGGASVTRVAINQRRLAWGDLVEAGVTPTETLIAVSYALTTTGGSAEARQNLIARIAKQSPDAKPEAYLKGARNAVNRVRKANADKRAERAAAKSTEPGEGTVSANKATVEQVIAFVQVMATRDWSDADKAKLSEALSEVSAHLA